MISGGRIATHAQDAFALFGQSVGGGGGSGGSSIVGAGAGKGGGALRLGGSGGDLDVSLSGSISTTGANATGIQAQSTGLTGAGDTTVTVEPGAIQDGSAGGTGVSFLGGRQNALDNRVSISSLSGLAVQAGSGDEWIVNRGLIRGDVHLGAGSNTFLSRSGGSSNLGGLPG